MQLYTVMIHFLNSYQSQTGMTVVPSTIQSYTGMLIQINYDYAEGKNVYRYEMSVFV